MPDFYRVVGRDGLFVELAMVDGDKGIVLQIDLAPRSLASYAMRLSREGARGNLDTIPISAATAVALGDPVSVPVAQALYEAHFACHPSMRPELRAEFRQALFQVQERQEQP